MSVKREPKKGYQKLLEELEGIRDTYRSDVRQFIRFIKERKLFIVEGLDQYVKWLDEEHDEKRYSPATINRKISAAKSRVRHAFKRSAFADDLRKKYRLEDILKAVRLRRIEHIGVPTGKVLSVEEAREFVSGTKDPTVRLMANFLVSTGVRVSEMLGILLSDLKPAKKGFVEIRITGKGSKERVIHVKKEFLDRIRKHFQGTTRLFEHNGKAYSRVSVTNRIKHESLKSIGKEVSAQQLRHTWAVIQIKRGKDVKAVAAGLGHADPGLTMRMYSDSKMKPEESFLNLEELKQSESGESDDGDEKGAG
jgi:site-specific recombinase XerD